MTDYKKLVEALRWNGAEYKGSTMDEDDKQMYLDAADAIERITAMYEKAEMDATNLTGKLAQAEADVERINREVDKRICTEIDLSNMVDALGQKSVYIVRCKDCKWSRSCGYISTRSYAEWKDWFCADGERGKK